MAEAFSQSITFSDQMLGCASPRMVYDLLGHEDSEQHLAGVLNMQKVHHAWLFSGTQGIGKAVLAYRFIRCLLGANRQASLDGAPSLNTDENDKIVRQVSALSHPDFLLVRREYDEKSKKHAQQITVAQIRRVNEFFQKTPSQKNARRVCLIDTADDMNLNAANALLKILEEPPAFAVIILLSHAPRTLLATLRSRCQSLTLMPVPKEDMKTWVEKNLRDNSANMPYRRQDFVSMINMALDFSGGAPGRALAFAQAGSTVLMPLQNWMRGDLKTQDLNAVIESLSLPAAQNEYILLMDAVNILLHAQACYLYTGKWLFSCEVLSNVARLEDVLTVSRKILSLRQEQKHLMISKKTILLQVFWHLETLKNKPESKT